NRTAAAGWRRAAGRDRGRSRRRHLLRNRGFGVAARARPHTMNAKEHLCGLCGLCVLPWRAVALGLAGAPVRHDERAIVSSTDFDPVAGGLVEIRDAVVREIAGALVPRPMQLPNVDR